MSQGRNVGLGKVRVQHLDPRTGAWSSDDTSGYAYAGLVDSNNGKAFFGDGFTGVLYYYKVMTDEYRNFQSSPLDDACDNC